MLTGVTISGVDGEIRGPDILDLSRKYPFVEWGILASKSRSGTPRYPYRRWRDELVGALEPWRREVKLSLHLCGAMARTFAESNDEAPRSQDHLDLFEEIDRYDRAQINGPVSHAALWNAGQHARSTEFILQTRSVEAIQENAALARASTMTSLLFDPSGGEGIRATLWPAPPEGVLMGYAGGITPETVEDVVSELMRQSWTKHRPDVSPEDPPYWIDMESGVRTDDHFDLAKVREVLRRAAPFVGKAAP